jgi:hypothetical protein
MRYWTLIICCLLAFSSVLLAGPRAEADFWSSEKGQEGKRTGLAPFPGTSYVEGGPMLYGNYGGSRDNEWTGGFRIEGVYRDAYEYLHFRLGGFVGVNGIAEGLGLAQVVLIKGLKASVGGSYTERLEFSFRAGLSVEDQADPRRRGGIYLLGSDGGGIELSWPLDNSWSVWSDFGQEEDNNDKYNRFQLGGMYRF